MRVLTLASVGAALILLGVSHPASAQVRPQVTTGSGLLVATFALPEGVVTAYLPDDVAPGETFSGTMDGPDGFMLTFGDQRARAGEPFVWTVPVGAPRQRFVITVRDRRGLERARAALETAPARPRNATFRFPPLVQAGQPLPIRGPFDGDLRTTRVEMGSLAAAPLAETVRRVIVRAPGTLIGPTTATLTKAGVKHQSAMRSLSVEIAPRAGGLSPAARELTVSGVSGIDRDVPLLIGGEHFYLRAADVAGQPTFTVRRAFGNLRFEPEARLVIAQSFRDEVAVVLRAPQQNGDIDAARRHGEALKALDFDALAAAEELLSDSALGRTAALAMLAVDQRRALPLILASIPESGVDVQFLGFLRFLDNYRDAWQVRADAREAALRVLARVVSTATAQLAVHVVGVTGSDQDLPMLERLYDNGRRGAAGLKDASLAALVRLGSREHLDDLRAELSRPLPPGASYAQAVRLSEVLRIAAIAGHAELVPAVCGHIADPAIVDVDIYAYPDRSAADTLSAIVDRTPPLNASKRPVEEWKAYCTALVAQTPPAQVPVEPGVLPRAWNTSGPNCNEMSAFQVHEYNPSFFILRQSGCVHFEKPFLYLMFGRDKALLEDTGAGQIDTASVVMDLVAKWAKRNNRTTPLPLIVVHSHSHGDHTAGDAGFKSLPNVELVTASVPELQRAFGIANWPTDVVPIDLGGRIVDLIPIPGHDVAGIALYDRQTGILLTGDSFYPGRLYVSDDAFPTFAASHRRLVDFTKDRPIAHILGTHIEQTSTPFVDYPRGTVYQPQEHVLELTRDVLLELHETLARLNGKLERVSLRDVTLSPLPPRR